MNHTSVLLFALALTTGCDEVGSEPADGYRTAAPDLSTLIDDGGCSDIILTRYAPDGGLSLVFSMHDSLAANTVASGTPQSDTIDLSMHGSLVLRSGSDVSWLECTDTFDEQQVIETEWIAHSGAVTLTTTLQEGSDMPVLGTITITDATLTADNAESVEIASMTWSAGVGWVAGG